MGGRLLRRLCFFVLKQPDNRQDNAYAQNSSANRVYGLHSVDKYIRPSVDIALDLIPDL